MYHVNTKHQWLFHSTTVKSWRQAIPPKLFLSSPGVLHFLRNDFHGFLDVAKPIRIEGSPFMVRRSSFLVGSMSRLWCWSAEVRCFLLDEPLTHWGYHSFWDVNPDIRLRQAEMNIRPLDSTFKHIQPAHSNEPWYTLVAACLAAFGRSFRHLLGSNRVKLFVRALVPWLRKIKEIMTYLSCLYLFVGIFWTKATGDELPLLGVSWQWLAGHKWGISKKRLEVLELQLCFQNLQDIWYTLW